MIQTNNLSPQQEPEDPNELGELEESEFETAQEIERPEPLPKLYEIGDVLADIYNILRENGGVLDDELQEALDLEEGDFAEKCRRLIEVIKGHEQEAVHYAAAAKPFQDEADRLKRKAKQRTSAADGLRGYLKKELERLDKKQVTAGTFDLSIRNVGGNVAVEWLGPADQIPDEFAKIERSFMSTKFWAWRKANPEATLGAWVKIHERGTNLKID